MQDPSELPPSVPVSATLPSLPESVPPQKRRGRVGIILGIVGVLVLASAFSALLFARSHNSAHQAAAILNGAASAHLRDTQFSVMLKTTTSPVDDQSGASSLFITGNGTGVLITAPFRLDFKLTTSTPGVGSTTAEEIATNDALYLKDPYLSTQQPTKKPWQKIAISPGTTLHSELTDFLDYSRLHDPRFIGEETVNGHKTWHIRAGVLDAPDGNNAATATAVARPVRTPVVTTEDLWILEDSHFPAQVTYQTSFTTQSWTSGGSSRKNAQTVTTDLTLVFTTWNTGIAIKLPPANQVAAMPQPTPPSTGQM